VWGRLTLTLLAGVLTLPAKINCRTLSFCEVEHGSQLSELFSRQASLEDPFSVESSLSPGICLLASEGHCAGPDCHGCDDPGSVLPGSHKHNTKHSLLLSLSLCTWSTLAQRWSDWCAEIMLAILLWLTISWASEAQRGRASLCCLQWEAFVVEYGVPSIYVTSPDLGSTVWVTV
jgi:hypothetical protein